VIAGLTKFLRKNNKLGFRSIDDGGISAKKR
jgi:hypothetical protein